VKTKYADGLVFNNGVLLVKRLIDPYKGYYSLPGGFINEGESAEEACVREVAEETGLKIKIKRKVGYIITKEINRKTVVFEAEIVGGELRLGDEASEVGFFQDTPKLLIPTVASFLQKAGALI